MDMRTTTTTIKMIATTAIATILPIFLLSPCDLAELADGACPIGEVGALEGVAPDGAEAGVDEGSEL